MSTPNITTVTTDLAAYPWALLLLADPDRKVVASYLKSSQLAIYRSAIGEVVGVIVWQRQSEHRTEIMNLAVAEIAQGQGIATALISYLFSTISTAVDRQTVVVKTGDTSQAALATYKKNGFSVNEIVKEYFVTHYPEPLYEEGKRLRNQVILKKIL